LGYTDEEHIEFAARKGWIILSFDDDFLSLVKSKYQEEHPGIIYASQHGRDVGELVRRVDSVLERQSAEEMSGEILYA